MRLTDISIRALKPPAEGAVTQFDDTLSGFGVRVSKGGTKTYVLVQGRSRTRTKIGRVGILTLAQAREKAKSILAEKQLGRYQQCSVTFSEGLAVYIEHLEKTTRPRTVYETKRLLTKYFKPKLSDEKIIDIRKGAITPIISSLADTPSQAHHAHVAVMGFFNWASGTYLEFNPIQSLQAPPKPPSRDRVLIDAELGDVFRKAIGSSESYAKLSALLILNGQRINQFRCLDPAWIDDKERLFKFPPSIMKGKRSHTLPYGELTSSILDTLPKKGLSFPANGKPEKPMSGISKFKAEFDEGFAFHYTHHDFRRTLRTFLSGKVPREVAERILDHKDRDDTELTYDRYDYVPEMRAALELWETKLIGLLSPQGVTLGRCNAPFTRSSCNDEAHNRLETA